MARLNRMAYTSWAAQVKQMNFDLWCSTSEKISIVAIEQHFYLNCHHLNNAAIAIIVATYLDCLARASVDGREVSLDFENSNAYCCWNLS